MFRKVKNEWKADCLSLGCGVSKRQAHRATPARMTVLIAVSFQTASIYAALGSMLSTALTQLQSCQCS